MNKTLSLFRRTPATHDLKKCVCTAALLTAILAGFSPTPSRAEGVIVQWEKTYNGPGNNDDWPYDVAVDSAGNVIVTGESFGSSGNADFYTAKYAAGDGTLVWERRYNGPANNIDIPSALAVDSAGNVIVTGISQPSSGGIDGYTAKYAATNGALLWERRFNGAANGSDVSYAVALDSAGNVLVTGWAATSISGSYHSDFYTAKYAAANGALLWEKTYSPTGNPLENDQALRVVVDSDDNVIIAGSTDISGDNEPITVVKYAATNGALLWSVRTPVRPQGAPANGSPSLAVDSAGNVIVVGTYNISGGNTDIYTAKYASASGVLLWEKRYNGPANGNDRGSGVAVDGAGNVTTTGYSTGSDGKSDIYRAKYAAADGALIWEKRYNLPADAVELVFHEAVDSEGNVIVTGIFHNGENHDIYTVKYAAEDGALLWEKHYNSPRNLSDYPADVILDGGGNVIVIARINYGSGGSTQDIYTVKYAPVDLDLDDDGLLDSWEIAHFGNTAAHSALDDTDGDGAVELLELAFGTDPLAPNSVPTPAVVIEDGYLTTTITKQPCVRYRVETTAALEAGFSAASTTVLLDTATTLKVRDNVLIGTQPTRFLRVQVTAAL